MAMVVDGTGIGHMWLKGVQLAEVAGRQLPQITTMAGKGLRESRGWDSFELDLSYHSNKL